MLLAYLNRIRNIRYDGEQRIIHDKLPKLLTIMILILSMLDELPLNSDEQK